MVLRQWARPARSQPPHPPDFDIAGSSRSYIMTTRQKRSIVKDQATGTHLISVSGIRRRWFRSLR